MPAYDYRCTDCDIVFEVTRKAGSTDTESCPECAGTTKRVFSPVGVVFKGSGFHNTDYKKSTKETASGEAKSDSSASPAPCAAAKSGDSACSSCPAAKAE